MQSGIQRGFTRKPAHLREFVELLYRETSIPMMRVAEGLGESQQLIASWCRKFPELPHRKKGHGNAPTPLIPAFEAEIATLRGEVAALRAKLADLGEPVGTAKELLAEIKKGMYSCLVGGQHDLKDYAQALRAAIALDEREHPAGNADAPAMIHYVPEETEAYEDDRRQPAPS